MTLHRLFAVVLLAIGALAGRATAEGTLPFSQGVLWEVAREGAKSSYLFGTVHSSDEQITALPPAVADVFDGSERLAIEALIDAGAVLKLSRAMLLPPNERLDELLSESQKERLAAAATHFKMPMSMVTRFKPWGVMLLFSLPPEEHLRAASGLKPLDETLRVKAEAAGKPVVGLETVDEQIETLDGMSREDQMRMLETTLDQAVNIEEVFAALRDAYLSRDLAGIYDIMNAAKAQDDSGAVQRFEQRLLVERNRRMVERMAGLLQAGNAFVAIGALHLPGEQGVLQLLADSGYQVTPVY